MSDTNIRHTRRSQYYMSPVLLDHSRQKKLVFSMALALVVVFLSGYVVGFKKAEVKLASFINTVVLDLPGIAAEFSADMEPQPPVQTEPGESIDVDSADQPGIVATSELVNVALVTESEGSEKPSQVMLKKPELELLAEVVMSEEMPAVITEVVRPLAIGGPLESDPGQVSEWLIQDTATEETAAYSIQVGMYGQLENAERKVEELVATDLSVYLADYLNRKNEIRYNVRFGYFADRSSAKRALATFEKELMGSGYIVRLPKRASASAGS